MDLFKLTQIRPVQAGNALELVKNHFRLTLPSYGPDFIVKAGELPFQEIRKEALGYLQSGRTTRRAESILSFLSGLSADYDADVFEPDAAPDENCMRYAYVLSSAFPDIFDETTGKIREEFSGDGLEPDSFGDYDFPAVLLADLIALLLHPGVLPQYRRWLSMMVRIHQTRASGVSFADLWASASQKERAAAPVSGTPLYRFLHGKVLMPAEYRADAPPQPERTEDVPAPSDHLLAGQAVPQLYDALNTTALPATRRKRAEIPDFAVSLDPPKQSFPAPKPMKAREMDATIKPSPRRENPRDE